MGPPHRLPGQRERRDGGLFNLQSTKLEAGGTNTLELGDQKIYNYHGYIAYNFGASDAKARPYFLGGAGATQYSGITTSRGAGRSAATRSSRPPGRSA